MLDGGKHDVDIPANARTRNNSDTIRRTLRVLGAMPLPATDSNATTAAARLLYERCLRAGIPVKWIVDNPEAPLVVAGEGRIAIITYLDDSHPDVTPDSGQQPPTIASGIAHGVGIERKAGVVAAIAPLLTDPELARHLTLIVETDRHTGSHSLERWLTTHAASFNIALWETVDLPLTPPVLVRSATGTLLVELQILSARERVEALYGGVLPDIGFSLGQFVGSLKTADEEVRLPGFYDGIVDLSDTALDALVAVAPGVSDWLRKIAAEERNLLTSHMTLGLFCAPALRVRSMSVEDFTPYLPPNASALIECQLMPGQQPQEIIAAIRDRAAELPFPVEMQAHLTRSPVSANDALDGFSDISSIPIAPGPSPASLFDEIGIATLGYAVVGRATNRDQHGMALDAIEEGSTFILSLVDRALSSRGLAR